MQSIVISLLWEKGKYLFNAFKVYTLPVPEFEPSLWNDPPNQTTTSTNPVDWSCSVVVWRPEDVKYLEKKGYPAGTQPVFSLFLLVFSSPIKQGFLSRDAGLRSALAAGASAWVKPTGPEWITGVHWIWRLCWIILGIRWLSWVYWSQEESSLVKKTVKHSLIYIFIFNACMTFYLLWKHKGKYLKNHLSAFGHRMEVNEVQCCFDPVSSRNIFFWDLLFCSEHKGNLTFR